MWSIIICSFVVLTAGQTTDDVIITTDPVLKQEPILTIRQGTVVGSVAENGEYFEFYGIPFADSTSGTHRFKAPNPPPSFEDTFIANRKDIKCIRALGVGYEGTEDCLVANVFTPYLDATAKLPVMVWIKGKEFDQANEPEFSFEHLIKKDVIVVALNYRESIFGYLCLGTETAPGNAGLKDIIAGLRWVQENIAAFGGDPDNVSLFGHGSGAAAVDLVTLSHMSNGLVHKAIAQSGTALAPWAVTRDNLDYTIQVAEALGHTITELEDLSEAFTRTSVAALMAVINELDLTDNSLAFAPCIEREDLQGVEPFLLKSPYQALIDRDFAQIPFMTGYVDVEGTIRATEAVNWMQRMETSFENFLQPDLQFENEEERNKVAEEIKTFYFGNRLLPMTIDDYLIYQGDTMMVVSAIREAQLRAATSSVYLYQFSYKGALGEIFNHGPIELESAAHSEELAYFYYGELDEDVTEFDLAVSDILIERWTNFAKTGNPTSDSSAVDWEPFATGSAYLRILDDEEVLQGTLEVGLYEPYNDAVTFWNNIYEDHFLDAKGRWSLSDRNDEDEELVDSSDEDNDTGAEDREDTEDGDDDNDNGDDNNDDEDSSATTAIGYTFLIISLFSILNHFHWSQILS